MTVDEIGRKITPVLRANDVEFAALFGSAARGDSRADSDVDILVRYSKAPGLFAHIGLAQALEDALRTKVDLVTENSLNKSLAAALKNDLQIVYGESKRQDLR
jgi:uncharacterized protein